MVRLMFLEAGLIMKKILLSIIVTTISIYCYSQSAIDSLLESGVNDYKRGQYTFAISTLNRYIQAASDDDTENRAKAYYYIALSHYFSENYRMAQNYLTELTGRYRSSEFTLQANFWQGLIYQNQKEWAKAEDSFLKYTKVLPNSDLVERAYLAAANSEIQQKKYTEAEKNLNIIVTKYTKSDVYEEASLLYSFCLMKNGKTEEAKSFLKKWIGILGETGEGHQYKDKFWLYLANIYLQEKNYLDALIFLKKIDKFAKGSESSDIALLNLSKIESELGNKREAREYLVRLGNEYPLSKYNVDATLSFGIEEFENENFSDSIVMFRQTIQQADGRLKERGLDTDERERLLSLKYSGYFYIAEIYASEGETKQASSNYLKVINESTNFTLKYDAVSRVIDLFLKTNDLQSIGNIINKQSDYIIKNGTSDQVDKFLIIKANYEYQIGQFENASNSLEQVKDKNKYSTQITNIKANILIKQRNYKDAIFLLEQSFNTLPLNQKSKAALELINIYYNIGEYKKAVDMYDVMNAYSKNIDKNQLTSLMIRGNYVTALSHMQLGNYQKSIDMFKDLQSFETKENIQKYERSLINSSIYYIGWDYYKMSNFIEAAKNFGAFSVVNSTSELYKDALYMEAWSYFSKNDFSIAFSKFDAIAKRFLPNDTGIQSLFYSGKCQENMNNIKRAVEIYTTIVNNYPKSEYREQSLFEIIKDLLNRKEIDKANDYIRQFGESYPASSLYREILVLQGDTFMSLGRFSEALSNYLFFIKRFTNTPNLDIAYYWGGFSALKIKDYITTKELLEYLIKNYPTSSFYRDSLILLQQVYNIEGNLERERSTIEKLLPIEKDTKELTKLNNRQKEIDLILSGNSKEEAALLLLLDNSGGSVEARLKLAKFYLAKGDEKGEKMIGELSSVSGEANNILGDMELDKNSYLDAAKLYLKTLSIGNVSENAAAEALYKAAYCYFKLESNNNAIKLIDRLKKNFPNSEWTNKAIELEERYKE